MPSFRKSYGIYTDDDWSEWRDLGWSKAQFLAKREELIRDLCEMYSKPTEELLGDIFHGPPDAWPTHFTPNHLERIQIECLPPQKIRFLQFLPDSFTDHPVYALWEKSLRRKIGLKNDFEILK